MKKYKELFFAAAFLLTAVLLLSFAGHMLRPYHSDYGSTWAEYLEEPEDSIDVLFLGSSYAYCDWNPGVMYAESGLTGYVMGGSEQTPTITYWYLREALKTQSPSAVVMEGSGLFFDRYQNYTQTNLVYMPWGVNRAGAILTAAEPEKRLGLFWDLYFYHSRWQELTLSDIKHALTPHSADALKGHTAISAVYDGDGPFRRELKQEPEVYAEHLEAIGKIADLCGERGIKLFIVLNPTYSRYDEAVYDKMAEDIALAAPGAEFLNLVGAFEETGLDGSKHLSDGWHLNAEGAAVYSAFTGRLLLESGVTPRPQSEETRSAWEQTAAYWGY